MSDSYLSQQNLSWPESRSFKRDNEAMITAWHLFQRAHRQGQQRRLWAALTRRSNRLLSLSSQRAWPASRGRYAGLQTVPIDKIRGTSSEGRANDFDADFHPLQAHDEERWKRVAAAWQLGASLGPVDLVQVGDTYFVQDGHHRISVARAMGQQYIEAVVTVWQQFEPAPTPQLALAVSEAVACAAC